MSFAFPSEQASSSREARTERPHLRAPGCCPRTFGTKGIILPFKHIIRAAELRGLNPLVLQIQTLGPSEME